MGRYIKYAARRESCVGWLGEIPDHWKTTQLKFLARFNYGDALASEIREDAGDIPVFGSNGVVGQHDRANTKAPVIFVGRKGSFGKVVYSDRAGFCIDTAYFVDKSSTKGHLKWLYYMLGQIGLDALSQDTGVPGLSRELAHSKYVVVPPESEQNQIAAFLDHETAKIDRLIARQERLIELLKEKRQAVISHAVIKGLNPDVPMKDSGVEWLGEVPAHWTVTQLQHIVDPTRQIMYGIVLPGPNVDDGVPIVKGGDVKPGRLKLFLLCKTTREIEAGYARSRLKAGDLVYSIRGTIGDVEIVPQEIEGANLTQDAARIAPAKDIQNSWLRYTLEADPVFRQLEIGSLGAAVKGINIRDLKKTLIPLPPFDERDAISNYLDKMIYKLELLQGKALTQIGLLREHRTALISAAVTGKIDVRGWQKPDTQPQETATAVNA